MKIQFTKPGRPISAILFTELDKLGVVDTIQFKIIENLLGAIFIRGCHHTTYNSENDVVSRSWALPSNITVLVAPLILALLGEMEIPFQIGPDLDFMVDNRSPEDPTIWC